MTSFSKLKFIKPVLWTVDIISIGFMVYQPWLDYAEVSLTVIISNYKDKKKISQTYP